jgi:hypothetical protein
MYIDYSIGYSFHSEYALLFDLREYVLHLCHTRE